MNDVYLEDHDNQLDIILSGAREAMRFITHVEIPAGGLCQPFCNPGGPGNDPTLGVTYTRPGPYHLEPVIMALDDPMTLTYGVPATALLGVGHCCSAVAGAGHAAAAGGRAAERSPRCARPGTHGAGAPPGRSAPAPEWPVPCRGGAIQVPRPVRRQTVIPVERPAP